jgi:photosystem II stability/assembly factor-like uncharacterized protein
VGTRSRQRWGALTGALSLTLLLAACGQTASTNTADSTPTPMQTSQSTATFSASPSPTDIPPPYAFPKKWTPAPDGADLPQSPASVGSFAVARSSPGTGYFCIVSSAGPDDSASVPPAVGATSDGGQTWNGITSSAGRYKSICQVYLDQTDAKDVFVAAGNTLNSGSAPNPLFRSQDGGATWKHINQPTITGNGSFIAGLAVVQSRILAMIAPLAQAGPPIYSLYASDDGGQTWKPITISANGQPLQFGEQMWVSGAVVYVEAGAGCTSACGGMRAPIDHEAVGKQLGAMPRTGPHSSGAPPVSLYFKSYDGGQSWHQISTPVPNLGNISVQRSGDGSTTYIVGTAGNVPNEPTNIVVAYYSGDGGATWRRLPTLQGVENGFPDPNSLGAFGNYVLPDGSVISTADHLNGTQYGGDAGAFLLNPADTSPSWRPLIRTLNGQTVQTIQTSTGVRVWGLQLIPQQSGGFLGYFDLP